MKKVRLRFLCSMLALILISPQNILLSEQNRICPLGVNLEQLSSYARSRMFVDVMKMCPGWGSTEKPWDGTPVARDADGWPKADFGLSLFSSPLRIDGGIYHISFEGQADMSWVAAPFTVRNKKYDASTNVTTADLDVTVASDGGVLILIAFKNTKGGVRNIRVIRPGYPADTKQIFTNEFLAAVQPFSTLRCMDLLDTNTNVYEFEWNDRLKPGQVVIKNSQEGTRITWEDIIELGNASGKALWINVPISTSHDYHLRLAQLFKERLNPNIPLYIEAGNEFFSWGFPASGLNLKLATQEGLAPQDRYARILCDLSNTFRSVYGDAAMMTQIRPVLATQYFFTAMIKSQLNYIVAHYGSPRKYIYAIAGAPYFGVSDSKIRDNPNSTIDDILKDMSATVDNFHRISFYNSAQATFYGVKEFAYEGGPDTTNIVNTDVAIASQRDPRMKDIVQRYLKNYWFLRGDLFMWFGLSGLYSHWGTWGLLETTPGTSPKYEGVVQVAGEDKPDTAFPDLKVPQITAANTTEVTKIGAYANIIGTKDNEAPPGTTFYWHAGEVYEYFMNASKGGIYGLKIGGNATGGTVVVYINEQLVGTWQMPGNSEWDQTPAISNELTFSIPKGYFTMRLEIKKQVWPDYITFTRCTTCFAPPLLTVSASQLMGQLPAKVDFKANALPDPSDETQGQTFTYQWSFGDGSSSKEQNPSHSYASPGSYLAKLTVTNFRGDTASSTISLQYSAPVSSGERNLGSFYVSPRVWRSDRDIDVTFHNVAVDGKIRIYNARALFKEITVNNNGDMAFNLKTEQFPSGTYFCRYTANDSGTSQTYKFVVVK